MDNLIIHQPSTRMTNELFASKLLVKVYDSLGSGNLSSRAKEQIAASTCTSSSKTALVFPPVQKLKGASGTVGHLRSQLLPHSVLVTCNYLTVDDLTEYERPVTGPLDTSFSTATDYTCTVGGTEKHNLSLGDTRH